MHVTVHSWLWMEYAWIPLSTSEPFLGQWRVLKGRSSSSMALVDQASTRSAWQEFIYIFANSISLTYSLSDAGIERYLNRAFH